MSDFSYGQAITKCIEELRAMVDSNTIIGQPIKTEDNITLIPVSKITFGIVSGGGDIGRKERPSSPAMGLGSGMNIVPVAFLVVSNGNVRIIPVGQPANTTVDRVIELVPGIIDRVSAAFKKAPDDKPAADDDSEDEVDLGNLDVFN